jgi:glycosyltransferase involved in cell wall biosynthesis
VKGQKLLVEAYEKAREELKDWNVVIIGDDWGEKQNISNLIKKFNLQDSVILIGHVDEKELIQAYASADIFVLPSYGEGLPTVMLEAMACGIPVVATDVGGVAEGLGGCGILTNPNADEILEALKKVCKDEELRGKISECEKKRISRFDWKIIAKESIEAYEKLIK